MQGFSRQSTVHYAWIALGPAYGFRTTSGFVDEQKMVNEKVFDVE